MENIKRERLALVVCSDQNLFWQGVFFLHRAALFDTFKRIDYYYYVTDDFPPNYARLLPENAKVMHWKDNIPDNEYAHAPHITKASVLRLYAVKDLAETYNRILYFDIDVFLRWGDLADLLQLPAFDAPFAAVRNRSMWSKDSKKWFAKKYLSLFPKPVHTKYFNAGMLLANGPSWLASRISERAIDFIENNPSFPRIGDQTAINMVSGGNWLELSPTWNWQSNKRYDFMIPIREPRLVHFTGPAKPWNDHKKNLNEMYTYYMRDWLQTNGLLAEYEAMYATEFLAHREGREANAIKGKYYDPTLMLDDIQPYIDRSDFGDVGTGIKIYGWNDDRTK